jgi:hypothetical protein
MVALRRRLPACVGSPFGSLHRVIVLALGYINLAAPTGRRTVACDGSPVPGPRGTWCGLPRARRGTNSRVTAHLMVHAGV